MFILRKTTYLIPVVLALLSPPAAMAKDCNLSAAALHSVGDHPVTALIQQHIDRCSSLGGGTVSLPAGHWVSGPLMLKDNVTLHLSAGSHLVSTGNPADFTPAFISKPQQPREALIIASHVSHVALTGPGTVDGRGDAAWWPTAETARQHLKKGDVMWFTQHFPGVPPANGMPRPWLIEFSHVDHGRIHDLHITRSPMWNVVVRDSQHIEIDNSTVINPPRSPNTDGIDVVSSRHVALRHLTLSTGDDDVSIKSGLSAPTLGQSAQPSKDIILQDITVRDGHGISVGSETAQGIGKVTLQRITFNGTENGIRVKSGRDRGSDIGPLYAEDIHMHHVHVPLVITDSYGGNGGYSGKSIAEIPAVPRSALTPFIHDIHIARLYADNADMAGIISGLPEAPLKNLTLDNVSISGQTGLQSRYATGSMKHVMIQTEDSHPALQQGPDSHWQQ